MEGIVAAAEFILIRKRYSSRFRVQAAAPGSEKQKAAAPPDKKAAAANVPDFEREFFEDNSDEEDESDGSDSSGNLSEEEAKHF